MTLGYSKDVRAVDVFVTRLTTGSEIPCPLGHVYPGHVNALGSLAVSLLWISDDCLKFGPPRPALVRDINFRFHLGALYVS